MLDGVANVGAKLGNAAMEVTGADETISRKKWRRRVVVSANSSKNAALW
jgi:hypothetical protein